MDQITPGVTYGLTALSLAIYAIPLVIVAYLVIGQAIKAPIRTWVPLLVFFEVFLLLHGVNELIGPDAITGLIYFLAGPQAVKATKRDDEMPKPRRAAAKAVPIRPSGVGLRWSVWNRPAPDTG
jgi:hypothetical protein